MDKRFSWSFLGVLIGVVGIGYGIYADFFKKEKPVLIFDVLSNTQVLDLKEDISELRIHYKDQDLKKSKKSLVLLTVRVSNKGNAPIKETDYYSKVPFGLKIKGGNIAELPSLINASRIFLKDNIKLESDSLNNIFIDKVPIDYGEYFTIKVLTICNNNELPEIIPFGEISGLKGVIMVVKSYQNENQAELSFWDKLNFGRFSIHFLRFFYYIFFIAFVGIFTWIPISTITKYIETKKQKETINKYRQGTKIELTDFSEIIFDIYKKYGKNQINWLQRTINDKKVLDGYILYIENKKKENRLMNDSIIEIPYHHENIEIERTRHFDSIYYILDILLEKKVINRESNNDVNLDFINELDEFNKILKTK